MSRPTRRWAFGNKRQKKKIRKLMETYCGCPYCCPEDFRDALRDKQAQRDLLDDIELIEVEYEWINEPIRVPQTSEEPPEDFWPEAGVLTMDLLERDV